MIHKNPNKIFNLTQMIVVVSDVMVTRSVSWLALLVYFLRGWIKIKNEMRRKQNKKKQTRTK